MDSYEELAARNIALAEKHHARTFRQYIRGFGLQMLGSVPIPAAASDRRTILLVRPDHLGDVLLTGPAIKALSYALPNSRLVALVGPWSASAISAFPEIDLTITVPFPGFARHPKRNNGQPYWDALRTAQRLRKVQADTAVIFRPDHWWGAMLARFAGIPHRVGFDLPDLAPFLTRRIPYRKRHAVEQNLALISPWIGKQPSGRVEVTYPVEDQARTFIADRLIKYGLPETAPRIVIHPGSGTSVKQWAPINWTRVADRLSTEWGAPIIFTGGDHERQLIEDISARMAAPSIVLAGETSVSQLAALYDGAKVVLGPDSGPLHLAAAVGTPTVHLYGPADPEEFGPWGDKAHHVTLTTSIPCRPCRILDWPDDDPACHPCVHGIHTDDVIEAALRVARAAN